MIARPVREACQHDEVMANINTTTDNDNNNNNANNHNSNTNTNNNNNARAWMVNCAAARESWEARRRPTRAHAMA